MKENKGRGRKVLHPRPVEKIELSTEHKRLRLILAVVFLVIGIISIAIGVSALFSKDSGWTEIEARSSQLNCSSDFVFLYCLGEGEVSATAENKALVACYSDAAEYAFRMFTNDVEYEDIHNMYYINRHPNEEMEVDDVLYQAFSMIQEAGDRSLYLGPVYEQYNGLFYCTERYQAVEYDPYRNQEIADYYREIVEFAGDTELIEIELLGDNRICLRVAQEYLDYASENEIKNFIDFYWMKNAFIVDYMAEEIRSAGYTKGCISSIDGFVRNLDKSEESYAYTFYDRVDTDIYPAASVQYSGPSSIVYLHDYPLSDAQLQYYYAYPDGEVRTAYLDTRDGFCKSAVSNLACYSSGLGCSEILLRMIPVYIADMFQCDELAVLAQEGIYSIYSRDSKIYYNDEKLTLTNLYRGEDVQYEAVLVK